MRRASVVLAAVLAGLVASSSTAPASIDPDRRPSRLIDVSVDSTGRIASLSVDDLVELVDSRNRLAGEVSRLKSQGCR